METELKERKLKDGDFIEVRYHPDNTDDISLVSQARIYWAAEMAIGFTLGIILAIVLVLNL